jgi:aspartyl-tRNA(Asn)/glutamyl-tRNA(Gln) amidotransferase subunit A
VLTDSDLLRLIDEPSLRSQTGVVDMTRAFLDRIERANGRLDALITITADLALADAARADAARRARAPMALDGLAVVIKDNIDVAGVPATSGSRLYEQYVPDQDAESVRRLRAAGAIVLGKSNLHELAYGATSNNPFYGAVRNPWDLERIPGGSSGGSGAALAADLCIAALGTDTGGSVRLPAAFTGISGIRPTFGRVSNRGVCPVSWSLDTVGPMARAVEDVARLFDVIAGYDPGDPRSLAHEQPAPPRRAMSSLKIGVPTNFFFDGIDPQIQRITRAALDVLRGLGARLVDIAIPGIEDAIAACTTIIRSEALAVYGERCSTTPELFGEDVLARLRRGEGFTGVDLARAIQRMHAFQQSLRAIFEQVDVVATPTAAVLPPRIDESATFNAAGTLVKLTYPWSASQLPAISMPCGLSDGGLPVGIQLVAPSCAEARLFDIGIAFQRATPWHRARPDASKYA